MNFPENYRITHPTEKHCFIFKSCEGRKIACIASEYDDFDHVSVSVRSQELPTDKEIEQVKNMFWGRNNTAKEDSSLGTVKTIRHLWLRKNNG